MPAQWAGDPLRGLPQPAVWADAEYCSGAGRRAPERGRSRSAVHRIRHAGRKTPPVMTWPAGVDRAVHGNDDRILVDCSRVSGRRCIVLGLLGTGRLDRRLQLLERGLDLSERPPRPRAPNIDATGPSSTPPTNSGIHSWHPRGTRDRSFGGALCSIRSRICRRDRRGARPGGGRSPPAGYDFVRLESMLGE